MVSQTQIENELHDRNYYKENDSGNGQAPPDELPPDEEPPDGTGGQGVIDKYGNMIAIGASLMFLLAIFPGQAETGGAE